MDDPAWGAARRIPAEGQFFVSTEQPETRDVILRQSAFPAVTDVSEQRQNARCPDRPQAVGSEPALAPVRQWPAHLEDRSEAGEVE
jgi:hypothetical protein